MILLLSACEGPYSTLDPGGPAALTAAWLWWAMFLVSMLVMVGVFALWGYAILRQPKEEDEKDIQRLHNRWIVGGGLVLPLSCITVLLAFGIPAGHSMLPLTPEEGDAFVVRVTGHQWWWEVEYPNDDITLQNEIHIPAGQPIDVHISSADVIHSFWVPRLAGKLDAVPGHLNVLRIQADEPGEYRGRCAEFCGRNHAHMVFTVIAHSEDDFEQWLSGERDD